MHRDGLFTTGEAAGMLLIPPDTIKRYVRLFSPHFSEYATRPHGRRYTAKDLEKLGLIRQLYKDNHSSRQVQAALDGEWIPPAKPQYNFEDLTRLIEVTRGQVDMSLKYAKSAKYYSDILQKSFDNTNNEFALLHKLSMRVDELEKRLAYFEQDTRTPSPLPGRAAPGQDKKSWLDRFRGD